MINKITADIIEIDSGIEGPNLAIFSGVHGNELAGVYALQQLVPKLQITRGKLYIAYANPEAIKAGVRMINKNLNRCFMPNNTGTSPEDIRARQLMKILDKCDALLDLHMFYDDEGAPFAICEENALDIVSKFDVDIISTNWSLAEPGAADGYMNTTGKIGICIECGPLNKSQEYTDFAIKTVLQFLNHFQMTPTKVDFSSTKKRLVVAKKSVHRTAHNFRLKSGYKNFDSLKPGDVIATDDKKQYIASKNECIIFPHYDARIGEESYIIGQG